MSGFHFDCCLKAISDCSTLTPRHQLDVHFQHLSREKIALTIRKITSIASLNHEMLLLIIAYYNDKSENLFEFTSFTSNAPDPVHKSLNVIAFLPPIAPSATDKPLGRWKPVLFLVRMISPASAGTNYLSSAVAFKIFTLPIYQGVSDRP